MKKHILALVLTVVCTSLYAVNPIKEGNMISGHVIVKGTEENIPYATILIKENGQGTVSNEEGQFEFRKPVSYTHLDVYKRQVLIHG